MKPIEIALFGLAGLVIIIALAITLSPQARSIYPFSAENYTKAKAAEIAGSPCATPPGYTDAQWREHMGHHPDQYRDCLK